MDFKELCNKIGEQNIDKWEQSKNGGGWINKKAKVAESVFVGSNAIIFSAQISGNARIFGNAWISGNAWSKSPLFIIGTRHSLTNTKYGYIKIGCHSKT